MNVQVKNMEFFQVDILNLHTNDCPVDQFAADEIHCTHK